jgi:hypothetical protein
MRALACGLTLLALAAAPPPRDPAAEVSAELERYYQNGKNEPAWKPALQRLAAGDDDQRRQSARYLRELLARSLKDERSGKAPWRATPFWGAGPENPARLLRRRIAAELGKAKLSAAALPVLRWYLDEEPAPRSEADVMAALARITGPEADELRIGLAGRPHDRSLVVVMALQQLRKSKADLPADRLAALCRHHRTHIRLAAQQLNRQRGGLEPAPFDPVAALRSPPLRELMKRIAALVVETPPAGAPLVEVTIGPGGDRRSVTVQGWLLKEEGDAYDVFTTFGRRRTYSSRLTHRERLAIEDLVRQVEALRKEGDPKYELSERGGLTGQFQGHGAGLVEGVLAHWLDTTKREALAARILLPALDSLDRDEDLVLMMRDWLGRAHGQRMLVAFVGERDYAEAERLARLVAERFPQTRFHHYARRLAEELPRRRDDFDELRLPTPGEWAELKRKLSRTEQIDYLCRRMRLLNCFQTSQPGGISYTQPQYAEPRGLSENASWGSGWGKTEVINPVVELLGDDKASRWWWQEPGGLGLTVADIPRLAGYLRDDWLVLAVSFWRDFHPGRTLHQTRDVFAYLINRVAGQDLCKPRELERMTKHQREQHIQGLIAWAEENKGEAGTEAGHEAGRFAWWPYLLLVPALAVLALGWYWARRRREAPAL